MSVWIYRNSGLYVGRIELTDKPSPTICKDGIYGVRHSQYWLENDNMPNRNKKEDKPPYRVPSMSEIAAIPWNGLKVASTFSGCGGSCLGYRLAGYRVVWANEFVPSAQESYRANMAKGGLLDCRDVKTITAQEILKATGLKKGELDLFDGSPPCQAFSTAGKRHKGWGEKKKYEGGQEQENETLFDHYVRLLRGLRPKVFVAENVSGLVKGTCKGMFLAILKALKESGYRVVCRVLDAQWLGVPQQRQRTIFVGVRNDLGLEPVHPSPLSWRYSVRDAIPSIMSIDQGIVYGDEHRINGNDKPFPTLLIDRVQVIREPDGPSYTHKRGRVIKTSDVSPTVQSNGRGFNSIVVEPEADLKLDRRRRRAYNGENVFGAVNPARDDRPCPTVQTCSIDTPLASERRKFTIVELRRICAFPDDFVLTGTYAQQWERLGNSVPPVMMFWIARTIRDGILWKGKAWKHDPACLIAGTGK